MKIEPFIILIERYQYPAFTENIPVNPWNPSVVDRESPQSSPENLPSLLSRAQGGGIVDWATLVSIFTPLVYSWLRQWGLPPEDAQNVGQAVMLSLHRQLKTYDPEQSTGTFRTWLVNLTRTEFEAFNMNHGRDQRNGEAIAHLEVLPETLTYTAEMEETVAMELNQLRASALEIVKGKFPQRDWDAFRQMAMEKHPVATVAENLGCQPNDVFMARSKILRKLRQEFYGLIEF